MKTRRRKDRFRKPLEIGECVRVRKIPDPTRADLLAGARQALGTAVVFGMLFATLVGVFFIPVFYVLMQRISERQWPFHRVAEGDLDAAAVHPSPKAGKADAPPSPARGD